MPERTYRVLSREEVTPELQEKMIGLLNEVDSNPSQEELAATSLPVSHENDLDVVLSELKEITEARQLWTTGKGGKRYEEVRAEAAELLAEGNRYFLDENGTKWYAARRQSRPLIIDLELLLELAGEDAELLDEVAPRRVSLPAFRAAVAAGRMDPVTFVQVTRIGERQAWVKFYPAL